MTRVAGADITKGKWVAVILEDGLFSCAVLSPTLKDLQKAIGPVVFLAVDIPIGLPEDGRHYPRPSDVEAKKFIQPRGSSVFYTPPRPVFDEKTHKAANRLHRKMTGKGLSILSWSLKAKILEGEGLCSRHNNVIEAHPEVSFRAMKGAPLEFSKKSWNGQDQRRRLLELVDIRIPDVLPEKPGHVPPDDILDAAAAAWTAHRFALGQAKSLPAQAVEDSGPIWY